MPSKTIPDQPAEFPVPARQPEIRTPAIPEEPMLPKENPDIIPRENPVVPHPNEIPAPAENPQPGMGNQFY
ncbi:MAG: hypothetical protein ACXVAY_08040 [Mucilaginibacter sp.]